MYIVIEIFICFLFLYDCISCNNSCKVIAGPPYTIFWEKEIDNIQLTNLTETGSTITYVPLETSEKSLLGDLFHITASNSFITVEDNSWVTAFDLREHVLNGNVSEKKRLYGQKYDDLIKLSNSLDDQSNPIIVIVKK
jgi:hypothetical protein